MNGIHDWKWLLIPVTFRLVIVNNGTCEVILDFGECMPCNFGKIVKNVIYV